MLRKLGDITIIELILYSGLVAGAYFFGKTFLVIVLLIIIVGLMIFG